MPHFLLLNETKKSAFCVYQCIQLKIFILLFYPHRRLIMKHQLKLILRTYNIEEKVLNRITKKEKLYESIFTISTTKAPLI